MGELTQTVESEPPAEQEVARTPGGMVRAPWTSGRAGAMEVQTPGANLLAAMSDAEFDSLVAAMKKGQDRVRILVRELMTENVHFGKVPGREDDPEAQFGLRKAGAEVILKLYRYVADIKPTITYGDPLNIESPAIRVHVRCEVHAGTIDGPIVGVGVGAANTWEAKYRYRNAARVCPKCGKPALIRSKWADKDGPLKGLRPWLCFEKKDGCGEKFGPEDETIVKQVIGRVANEDAQDLENTLVKIASKRGKVDGAINATNSSDIFTQDVEDMEHEEHGEAATPATRPEKPKGDGTVIPPSDGQVGMIRALAAKKLGAKADAAIWQQVQKRGWASEWPPKLAREASAMIDALKAMPDLAGAGGGKSDEEKKKGYRERIDTLINQINMMQSDRVFVQEIGGIEFVVDPPSLGVLGYKDMKAIDELSLDELELWGKWLRFQPGAAMPEKAGTK